ncbi:hypothetical protein IE81DRAFT_365483 [Ceraceosorus guamensis]|uniref:Uncharacterized protein n=1 Tax=Ceraceosorus guamensis TaxID=1522189 RepID=A0A316W277_9BASI|nr:hypothetical protein IE81DRAFT_365483 [Ceraceosorus guamensis]PWN43852.1 hypothetical protein IE81DRAFT_365483 [Ceraceosorus guamensis]
MSASARGHGLFARLRHGTPPCPRMTSVSAPAHLVEAQWRERAAAFAHGRSHRGGLHTSSITFDGSRWETHTRDASASRGYDVPKRNERRTGGDALWNESSTDPSSSRPSIPVSPQIRLANVRIDNVPHGATPHDIYRLSPISRHITAFRFRLRSKDLSKAGRVYLSFDPSTIRSCEPAYPLDEKGKEIWKEAIGMRGSVLGRARDAADKWIKEVDGSILAGQMLKVTPFSLPIPLPVSSSALLSRLIQTESGKLVHLQGLPANLTALHLERILKGYGGPGEGATSAAGRYEIRQGKIENVSGEVGPVWRECGVIKLISKEQSESPRASFLIRLQTVPEANRLVHEWDGRVWEHKLGEVIDTAPRFADPSLATSKKSGDRHRTLDSREDEQSKSAFQRKQNLVERRRQRLERSFEEYIEAEEEEAGEEWWGEDQEEEALLQGETRGELSEKKDGRLERRLRQNHTRLQRMQHLLIRNTHIVKANILY